MRSYMITILSMSFGLAAATTTTSTATSSLPSLAAQIPDCAAGCFPTVGTEIGCHTADLVCMCSQATIFQVHLQECMSKHKCSKADQSTGSNLALEICAAMSEKPNSADIMSASSLVVVEVAKATANAAVRKEYEVGMAGVAALAAFIL
ncbi:hypothetical protein ACHAO4_007847 [Trichoderma viride]